MFAAQFFELPVPIIICLEDYSAELFHHPLTPSFTSIDHGKIMIVFNRDWVYKSMDEHADDIQFFMLHELRHSNQFVQIIQAENGEQTQDSPDTLMQWKQSYGSYTHLKIHA